MERGCRAGMTADTVEHVNGAQCPGAPSSASSPRSCRCRHRVHGPRTHLAHLRIPLPRRRRTGGAHRARARARRHHRLPRGRHRHRPVGPGTGEQRAGHPAFRRVRGGADAVPGRPGVAAEPALEHAAADLRARQRTGAGLRGPAVGGGLGLRAAVARGAGRCAGAGAVVHRDRAAGARRAQPDAHGQRAEGVLDPALPGRGGHPHPRAAAAAGCRGGGRGRRGAAPHGQRPGAGGREDRRRGGRDRAGRAPAAASAAALDRAQPHAGDLHGCGAAAGGRHGHADAGGGPVDGAGRLPGRRAAGRERIPPRAWKPTWSRSRACCWACSSWPWA